MSDAGSPTVGRRHRFPGSSSTKAGRRAFGGIRLPELQAPVAAYRGAATGTGLPPLFGAARPFPAEKLRSMYPSPGAFEGKWRDAVANLVASEAIRPEDAAPMLRRLDDVRFPDTGSQ
jgi:hypothetical protein